MSATILIADDDLTIRTVLGKALSRQGFKVRTTAHAATLWHWASQGEGDLIITDVMMPDGNGLELVPSLQRLRPEVKIIVISAQNSLSTSVKAQELDVFGFLPKPFDLKEITGLVETALATATSPKPKPELINSKYADDFPLVGKTKAMNELFRKMGKVATAGTPVLITGGRGSGKTLAATSLLRSISPSVEEIQPLTTHSFNELFEASAKSDQPLFVEGVDQLDPKQQSVLSTYLDGSKLTDKRVLFTSNLNLGALAKAGRFDQGLADRLAALQIKMPDLTQRLDDIPLLIEAFQKQLGSTLIFAPEVLEHIKLQSWKTNVHGLKNLIIQLVTFVDNSRPSISHIDELLKQQEQEDLHLGLGNSQNIADVIGVWVEREIETLNGSGDLHKQLTQMMEKPLIEHVLARTKNNQIKTATLLGLNRNTLRKKIVELGIQKAK